MSSIKHSLGNLGTKLLLYPISFVTSIVIARYLGPEERGIYTYLTLLVSFLIPIVSLGFGGGIAFYISNKKYAPKDIIFTVSLLGSLLGLLLAILIMSLWQFSCLGETGKLITRVQMIAVSCSIIFSSTVFFITRLLLGDSKFPNLNILEIVRGITNPILLLVLVWLMGMRVTGAALTLLSISVIGFLYILYISLKFYKPVFMINWGFVKDALIYGFKGWLGDMAIRANVRLDQIILGSIVSAKALGIYAIAVLLSELLWIIPDAIGPVLFTKIAAIKDLPKQIRITKKIHSLLFYTILITSLFFTSLCYYFIIPILYGVEYTGAMTPFLFLIPGTVLMTTTKVMSKLLSATGHIFKTSIIQVNSSIVSIVLYILLIPSYDFIGAAFASSVGYIFGTLLSLYYFKSFYKQSILPLFYLNKEDVLWSFYSIKKLLNSK